jgi:hydrogenase-4 component E
MSGLSDALLVAALLLGFATLGSSRLTNSIRLAAAQGALISVLPLVRHGFELGPHVLLLVGAPVMAKGVLMPWLLLRAIREADMRREMEPFIGYTASLLLGTVLTGAGFLLAAGLPQAAQPDGWLLAACALATVLLGALMMVSRRKAVTQVLGYLMLENGIFLFGQGLATDLPVLVELGVLLDLLVAVFVMGITIFHINREFDSIAVPDLTALHD